MAGKGKVVEEPPLRQCIFASGADAAGLASLVKGFGRTAEDDRLFALGWPHLVYLVPGDASAQELADGPRFAAKYVFGTGEVKVGVAPRMLRFLRALRADSNDYSGIRDGAPLTDAEVDALVDFAASEQFGAMVSYLLEALRSPSEILEKLLKVLEARDPAAWFEHPVSAFGAGAVHATHFLRLRVPQPESARAGERLAALLAKLDAVEGEKSGHAFKMLQRVVSGRPEQVRHLSDLEFLGPGDAQRIRDEVLPKLATMKPADREWPDARLIFLGGEPVLLAHVAHHQRFNKDAQRTLMSDLARMAHPKAVALTTR